MAIQMCDHHETQRYISACDCGQEVDACVDCLADDKVLCCGNCDCKEAVKMEDGSLCLTRKYIKTAREVSGLEAKIPGLQQKVSGAKAKISELKQKMSELKAEEWELERVNLYLKKIVAEREENL